MIESQNQAITSWMKRGHSITCLQAFRKFGCAALHSRISDIRKQYQVDDEWVKIGGKRFKKYYMNTKKLAR